MEVNIQEILSAAGSVALMTISKVSELVSSPSSTSVGRLLIARGFKDTK